jgi:membrane protease YdiL (CAAX protease family)
MSVLFNSQYELRSGWKFAIFLVWLVVFFFIAGLLLSLFLRNTALAGNQLALLGVNVIAELFAAVGATICVARFVEHKPVATFGISLHKRWHRDFLVGIVTAAAMLAAMVLGCVIFGQIQMIWNGFTMLGALLLTTTVLIGAAAFEEILFRGYPLQVLMRGMGVWPAILLMSALFGILHAGNPNASALGIINTILAGIWLSVAYLKTRSLWFPYGLHLGWNAGLGLVLGLSLSGLDLASLWTTNVNGSETLLGGGYGPEGGIVGTIVFVAGMGLIRFWKSRNDNQEIQ